VLDLPLSVRIHNLLPYLSVAIKNFDLLVYLMREVTKTRKAKIAQLREFVPTAKAEDWTYYEAGQRAQIIKPNGKSGSLQFGTEVISARDGSIAGLLGASPGASVSSHIMLEVCQKLFGNSMVESVHKIIDGMRGELNADPGRASSHLKRSARILKLNK